MKSYFDFDIFNLDADFLLKMRRDLECDISWLEQELLGESYLSVSKIKSHEGDIKSLISLRLKVLEEIERREL
jgi:hypothetical protein